jgi:hypothetical protein
MRKTLLLPFITLVVIACQKDQNLKPFQDSNPAHLLPNSIKTPDDVFSFLSREMPEVYTPAEISRLRTMLTDIPENNHQRNAGMTVELPAGSVDGLQAAVDAAGEGGTVIVKAGEHTENGLVTIGHKVNIVGEPGAVINLNNEVEVLSDLEYQFSKGIRIVNADRTVIKGIHFTTSQEASGIALFIDHSDRVFITGNTFSKFLYTIQINYGNYASIRANNITSGIPGALGITIINGKYANLIDNKISGMQFGIWPCDKGGLIWGNTTTSCIYGQILCKVPEGYYDYDGNRLGAEESSNHWLVAMNESNNNIYAGYVVIDGANKNILLGNKSSGNGAYDIDLVGPTERFGFFTPTSFKNRVYGYPDQTIKDCGEDNKVIGGIQIDTSMDPCDNVE